MIGVEERSGQISVLYIFRQLQPFPELLGLLALEELVLLAVVDLLDDLEVLVLDAPEIVLLGQGLPGVLELVDEGVLDLADVEDEILLLFTPFFQSRSNTQ